MPRMPPTPPSEFDGRFSRGQAIAQVETNVRRIDQNEYRVRSQSGSGEYTILSTEAGWKCSCPDATYREVKCKHIFAVELSLELRRRIENAKRVVPLDYQSCLSCGSTRIVKHGVLHNKSGDLQRYSCRDCSKRFTMNLGFERMQASPKAITGAMQLYFTGESYRNVQKFLRMQGVKVSHVTIYNWVRKYVGMMERYLKDFEPNVGNVWRADEVYVKFKGNMKYLFALMDDETRFWIAQQVADNKGVDDITPMLREAKEVAHKIPQTFITDAAPNFHLAYRQEFRHTYRANDKRPTPVHVREIQLAGAVHNNKQERLNGEFRDREKVMRGLKNVDSPALKGLQIYHNYVRPHEGLKGKTPAEVAGIQVEGSNKWLTLIQNASHVQRINREESVQ
jgi:putative transposase